MINADPNESAFFSIKNRRIGVIRFHIEERIEYSLIK